MNSKQKTIASVPAEHLCHSCGACFAACNNGSISFKETVGGYLFPHVNNRTCNNCGLCYGVCSGLHFGKSLTAQTPADPFIGEILSCYTGRASDVKIFRNSQSGGVATSLLAHLLNTGKISAAIVATMQSATPPRGDVLLVSDANDLAASQKSKYIPIPILSAIPRIRTIDGYVALVGLSCQMHGLYNLLDLYPDLQSKVLVKIGLICDRVMTNASVDFLGKSATGDPYNHLTFRDKQNPSYPGNPVVETVGGEKIVLKASLRLAIKDFFTPARCRLCFDKLNVFADVVLGDPHGLNDIDRIGGETLILARTAKGQQLISEAVRADDISIRSVEIADAVNGQQIEMKRSQWAGYMKAQSELKRPLPAYPEAILKIARDSRIISKPYKASLLYSLGLDKFSSRDELIAYVEKAIKKKRLPAKVPFSWIFDKWIANKIFAPESRPKR